MRPSWNLTVCMEISHVFLVLWNFTVCTEVLLKIVVKLPQILWSGIAISLKNFRMYGSFHKIVVKLTQKLWSGIAISLKIFRMYGSFCIYFGWGILVNINFWPLTLTVFINFDGCWIMVVKNTPFFQVFQLSKISRKSQKLTNFCFFFSGSFKIFQKNRGGWASTFWSYPCA